MKKKAAATCAQCGATFVPKDTRFSKYCSRSCSFEQMRESATHRHQESLAAKAKALAAKAKALPECEVCGSKCEKTRQLTCSAACRKIRQSRAAAQKHKESYQPKTAVKNCKNCGVEFTATMYAGKRIFCSSKCSRKYTNLKTRPFRKHRQRARKYNVDYEPVNRQAVFDRDGWRCMICGVRTPKAKLGKLAPNSPELDHRIPISKGGPHTYENVQCACRSCNSTKGNATEAGQMTLFAFPHNEPLQTLSNP